MKFSEQEIKEYAVVISKMLDEDILTAVPESTEGALRMQGFICAVKFFRRYGSLRPESLGRALANASPGEHIPINRRYFPFGGAHYSGWGPDEDRADSVPGPRPDKRELDKLFVAANINRVLGWLEAQEEAELRLGPDSYRMNWRNYISLLENCLESMQS